MTKHYEEFLRVDIEKIDTLNFELKGELTIVISEKKIDKKSSQILDESDKRIINQMINKLSIKDIVNLIHQKNKISKKLFMIIVLRLKMKNKLFFIFSLVFTFIRLCWCFI